MSQDASTCIAAALARAARPCVTCSFQTEDVVLVDLLRQVAPAIPVLFIDTGHHFDETLRFRDALVARWQLNLQVVRADTFAIGAWQTSTDACCARHKVGPLFAGLRMYDTWFTGLRREQASTRANLEVVASFQLPDGTALAKVSPLAAWTARDLDAYTRIHELPVLPLYAQGYTSIGCAPCTRLPSDPLNPRSGRWGGAKMECGIHMEPQVKS